jgi:serine/threonine-protein kinase
MHHGSRVRDGAAPAEEPARIGTCIGKYEIVRIVGKGGMGCVYEAVNTTIKKRVAIKCIDHQLLKNDEAYERFQREALAASSIESPHIVQIFDAGKTDDGVPYIVMELLRGSDLGLAITEVKRLELDDTLHVGIQILKGLHHAHTAGIVHRDLKPDNVFLVEREDEPHFVKLLDFGVSKMRGGEVPLQTLTRQGTVVGTPYYMSPEQAQAFPDIDGRTDLYSVGAILYECLTGRPPHVGKTYEQVIVSICMKDADDVRTHNPGVPAAIAKVIKKALNRERDERYQSAREMLDALVDAAPESFRSATPSANLRRVTLRRSGAGNSGSAPPQGPFVISPVPHTLAPSELADTISAARTEVRADDPLKESGVQSSRRSSTLASDNSGVAKRRRWVVAAAPGVVLLVGLAFYLRFVGDGAADESAVANQAPDARSKGASKKEDGDHAALPASPPTVAAASATASASASASALARPERPSPNSQQPLPNAKLPPSARPPQPPLAQPPSQPLQPPTQPPGLELQPK